MTDIAPPTFDLPVKKSRVELRITLHVSYIAYNELKCVCRDDYVREKLDRFGYTAPNPAVKAVTTVGLEKFVGRECTMLVKLIPYNFVSQHKRNKGEHMRGVTLHLLDIDFLNKV